MARDVTLSNKLRVEAITGLAATRDETELLEQLVSNEDPMVAEEAERVLRLQGVRPVPVEDKPPAKDLAAWNRLLGPGGDAAVGRRLFFASVGPRCATCHQHDNRGGRIGPDLTYLSRSNSRERIIASILQPSQDIAPRYQPWLLHTVSGKSIAGLRIPRAGDSGEEFYANASGEPFMLPSAEIEYREVSQVSIMPSGLEKTLTIQDLRDLVEFLATSGSSKDD